MTDGHPTATTVGDQFVAEEDTVQPHTAVHILDTLSESDRRRRRRDGHHAAGRRSRAGRLRGPRGLQRDPQRHPARRGAGDAPGLLHRGRGRGRDQHVRREPAPTSPSTTSRSGSASSPRRAPRLAREVADEHVHRRTGPGSCSARSDPAPSCRRSATSLTPPPRRLRRAGRRPARRRRRRVVVETCQDLLQAKSAIIGARRAMADAGIRVPIMVQVTVETTGTMLLGSRDRRRARPRWSRWASTSSG